MVILSRSTGLKIIIYSVLMLIFFNILINYFNNVQSFLRIKKLSISVANTMHSKEEDDGNKNIIINNSFITSYKSILKLNKSLNKDEAEDQQKLFGNIKSDPSHLPIKTANETSFLKKCVDPATNEGGPVTPNATLESLDIVEGSLTPFLNPGGWFQPQKCKPKHHVAIIVPFRDRYAHLSIFLRNIHPFLMKQNIEYRIFIVEQTNGKPFNRAALMNIGFLEALKFCLWDCFIFHDVDLLPLDDRNLYTCPRQPRHMSVAIDTFGFRLPYKTIFGGVSAMTREHFLAVNGFSNSFFGWGGEDDDMSNRLKHANLYIARYPINIARYMMLSHQKERANPKRFEYLVNGANKFELDGLNSIKYEIYSMKEFPIFTWYLAELKISDQRCQS